MAGIECPSAPRRPKATPDGRGVALTHDRRRHTTVRLAACAPGAACGDGGAAEGASGPGQAVGGAPLLARGGRAPAVLRRDLRVRRIGRPPGVVALHVLRARVGRSGMALDDVVGAASDVSRGVRDGQPGRLHRAACGAGLGRARGLIAAGASAGVVGGDVLARGRAGDLQGGLVDDRPPPGGGVAGCLGCARRRWRTASPPAAALHYDGDANRQAARGAARLHGDDSGCAGVRRVAPGGLERGGSSRHLRRRRCTGRVDDGSPGGLEPRPGTTRGQGTDGRRRWWAGFGLSRRADPAPERHVRGLPGKRDAGPDASPTLGGCGGIQQLCRAHGIAAAHALGHGPRRMDDARRSRAGPLARAALRASRAR